MSDIWNVGSINQSVRSNSKPFPSPFLGGVLQTRYGTKANDCTYVFQPLIGTDTVEFFFFSQTLQHFQEFAVTTQHGKHTETRPVVSPNPSVQEIKYKSIQEPRCSN